MALTFEKSCEQAIYGPASLHLLSTLFHFHSNRTIPLLGYRNRTREVNKFTQLTQLWTSNLNSLISKVPLPPKFLLKWYRKVERIFLKIYFIYFQIEGKGGRQTSVCKRNIDCLTLADSQLHRRHVPWLGIEPVTFLSTGWCSIHWTTPARTREYLYMNTSSKLNNC